MAARSRFFDGGIKMGWMFINGSPTWPKHRPAAANAAALPLGKALQGPATPVQAVINRPNIHQQQPALITPNTPMSDDEDDDDDIDDDVDEELLKQDVRVPSYWTTKTRVATLKSVNPMRRTAQVHHETIAARVPPAPTRRAPASCLRLGAPRRDQDRKMVERSPPSSTASRPHGRSTRRCSSLAS